MDETPARRMRRTGARTLLRQQSADAALHHRVDGGRKVGVDGLKTQQGSDGRREHGGAAASRRIEDGDTHQLVRRSCGDGRQRPGRWIRGKDVDADQGLRAADDSATAEVDRDQLAKTTAGTVEEDRRAGVEPDERVAAGLNLNSLFC